MSCRDCDPSSVCPGCGQHTGRAPVPLGERIYGGIMPHPQCYFPHTTGLPMRWMSNDYRLYGIDPETGWAVDLERRADAKRLMKNLRQR